MNEATMSNNKISQNNPNAWRNPWVLGWIVLLLVVVVVNIAMISIAFITNPGLVTDDYYEKGQSYEKNIKTIHEARKALGWTFSTDFPTNPVMNKPAHYSFNIVDKKGLALSEAAVTFSAYRPSDADADFSVTMIETISGRYEANINFPLKGLWEISATIVHGEDNYDFTRRTSVLAE
jgi:nitrogen fixation protein FixH